MEVANSAFTMSMGSNVLMTIAPEGVEELSGVDSGVALTVKRNLIVDGTLAVNGVASAPTAVAGTNTTQLATTAFVTSAVAPKAPSASPTFTGVTTLDASGDILNIKVKGVPMTFNASIMSDVLATTQSGRVALAKALDFGINKPVYQLNGYLPLLNAGYSGKGVYYAHLESGNMNFFVPPFRHLVNPKQIYSTDPRIFDAYDNVNFRINNGNVVHQYGMCGFAVAFDLHAKLINGTFGSIAAGTWTTYNPDAFYMGVAYNADVASGWLYIPDSLTYSENPSLNYLDDDLWVDVMEKCYKNSVKVGNASLSWTFSPTYLDSSGIPFIDTSGTYHTGVNNAMSYICSLAADNDMVYCNSAGNNIFTAATVPVASPGTGRMQAAAADARNILSVGSSLINDGTVYTGVLNAEKLYARNNYYKNPTTGLYRTSAATGFTERELGAYTGHGRTPDTAGPGQTNRLKPDILSAVGGADQYVYWPSQAPNADTTTYGRVLAPPTSATSPTIAGGVCLLREALPLYDAHQIRECILRTGSNASLSDPDTNVGLGRGLINLEAALAYGRARPRAFPPRFNKASTFTYSDNFLASISAGALDTLNAYQPFDPVTFNFVPKSVQSFKCPKDLDLSGNTAYQTAYAAYEVLYNAYVASAPSLWTAGVLDLSPAKGLWGTNPLRSLEVEAPTFNVVSARSWISVEEADMQEIKDLMVANNIKVKVTSEFLGAFSVQAESPEQLAAVVNGNFKIRHVTPVQMMVLDDNGGMLDEAIKSNRELQLE